MDFNVDFGTDFDADLGPDFHVDFSQNPYNLADFGQNLTYFTDFLICHKFRFRLITKYRSFVLIERPNSLHHGLDKMSYIIYYNLLL